MALTKKKIKADAKIALTVKYTMIVDGGCIIIDGHKITIPPKSGQVEVMEYYYEA